MVNNIYHRYPELKEFFNLLRHEIQQAQRPASEIVMDDEGVMEMLRISKRKLQYMKSGGILPYHKLDPASPRTYYLLSDILDLLKKNRNDIINPKF